jgi:hypothetical protein
MTDPTALRTLLVSEVGLLEPFDFVAVLPTGRPLHVVEVTRSEEGAIEVRVPGRPPIVPALSEEERAAIEERGFTSSAPADPMHPWRREVEDAAAAVELVQALLVEVFGEAPDATLDIGHGNHRAEHEARAKLALARTRIEKVVTDVLGKPAEQDADGDYLLPVEEVHVTVAPRAMPNGQIVVRIFAIANVGVSVTPELGLFLARLNFGLMFGRFALDAENRAIWFDETLLGEQFREEELRFAIGMVATTADEWDDRMKQMFGGLTYQEVLESRGEESPPPVKPGAGVGMYL